MIPMRAHRDDRRPLAGTVVWKFGGTSVADPAKLRGRVLSADSIRDFTGIRASWAAAPQ